MVCIHAERELKSYTGCGKKVRDLTPEKDAFEWAKPLGVTLLK